MHRGSAPALLLACALALAPAHARADGDDGRPRLAATVAPVAQLARMLWPQAEVRCLAPVADPHAVQLAPRAAAAAREAAALVAAGALDAGWRPPHAHTIVLFGAAGHGWLDPQALAGLSRRIAADAARAGLPPPADLDAALARERARWRALVARHAPVGAVYAHGAWRPWLADAGVTTLAVLEAREGLGAGPRRLSAALARARGFAGVVLLVRPAERASAPLAWLAARLGGKARRAPLPALGACSETWAARMERAYRALAGALGE